MYLSRLILSTLILSVGIAFISPNVLVLAQTSESDKKPESTQTPRNRTPEPNQTPRNQPPRYERGPRYDTRPSVESGVSSSNKKRATDIQSQVLRNQQVKNYCQDIRGDIEFELDGDQLEIITGDHQCSYRIIQEVLEPQLKQGRIKTYEFSGDQEDIIVSF